MTNGTRQAAPTVNVLLMLNEHGPKRYQELEEELQKIAQREKVIRDEMDRLERHAAIEGLDLTAKPTEEPTP